MKVAFTIFGGAAWTGGINYLRNMLSAIHEIEGRTIEPVLFHAPDVDRELISTLLPYLSSPPVIVPEWSRSRLSTLLYFLAGGFFCDRVSFRYFEKEGIDLVFQNGAWYGFKFPIPTLAWIPDFQHKYLRYMFGFLGNLKRNIGYTALSYSATRVLVSSKDAKKDCELFLPKSIGKISVLPFSVMPVEVREPVDRDYISTQYGIDRAYFYLPNQFWMHKNHKVVVGALDLIVKSGLKNILIVATGNPKDFRNPKYPDGIFELLSSLGLQKNFIFLGMIPYVDIGTLMRGSIAVLNPSLFEGWSTTVEEAKSVGAPLILSNLAVHKEQTEGKSVYFNPHDANELAVLLSEMQAKDLLTEELRFSSQRESYFSYLENRNKFALNISNIFEQTVNL